MSPQTHRRFHQVAKGAISGFIATVPMSATMLLLHRQLEESTGEPLPPRQVVDEFLGDAAPMSTSDAGMDPVMWAAHFAFGAAAGGLYGAMMGEQPQRPFLSGMAFGLGIWGSHYGLGFPMLGLRASAIRQPKGRNLMMIAAHVVWGAALGDIQYRMNQSQCYRERHLEPNGNVAIRGERNHRDRLSNGK